MFESTTDMLCDTLANWSFKDSTRIVKHREYVAEAKERNDDDSAMFWDKHSAKLEGRIIEKADRIIAIRSR